MKFGIAVFLLMAAAQIAGARADIVSIDVPANVGECCYSSDRLAYAAEAFQAPTSSPQRLSVSVGSNGNGPFSFDMFIFSSIPGDKSASLLYQTGATTNGSVDLTSLQFTPGSYYTWVIQILSGVGDIGAWLDYVPPYGDPYPEGASYTGGPASDQGPLADFQSGFSGGSGQNFAFQMTFSTEPVPEPAPILIFCISAILLGLLSRWPGSRRLNTTI
jgi:hypothetical protein